MRKQRYWTILDARGRVIADGLTPPVDSDRDAIGWVLRGGLSGRTLKPDAVYRVRCGDAAATAHGDELGEGSRVDASSTSTDAWCDVADHRGHLHSPPARTATRDETVRGIMKVIDWTAKRITEKLLVTPCPVQPRSLGDVELRRLVTARLRAAGYNFALGATWANNEVDVLGMVVGDPPGLLVLDVSLRRDPGYVSRVRLEP